MTLSELFANIENTRGQIKRRGLRDLLNIMGEHVAQNIAGPGLLAAEHARSVVPEVREPARQRMTDTALGLLGAIKAYHGSPHKFDKFSMDRIGTGEGAQAYGHGLYFAEHPETAQSYKKTVPMMEVNGKPQPVQNWAEIEHTPEAYAAKALWSVGQGPAAEDRLYKAAKYGDRDFTDKKAAAKALELIKAGAVKPTDGQMYEVSLRWPDAAREAKDPLGPQHFLDWDKPLSQQPESVRKAFGELGFDTVTTKFKTPEAWHKAGHKYLSGPDAVRLVNTDMSAAEDIYAARKAWNQGADTFLQFVDANPWLRGVITKAKGGEKLGSSAYGSLADKLGGFGAWTGQGGGQVAATEKLKSLGIPGIRYLDGGSRAAGEGTANYVAFDDALVDILKRNGVPVKPDAPQGLLGKRPVANVSPENKLVAMHNLSAENLRHAERMGGLPVPSVAISKVSSPLDGFGEISLIADSAMVTPGRKNPVFAADAYSQRYPSVEYKVTGPALKQLNDALKKYGSGERPIYGDEIRRVDDLVSVPAFKKYASDVLGKDADFSQRKELAEGLLSKVGAEERIFKGYTYSGNRRYSPHTLENVIKEMTGDPRGGESFNYGINSLKAQVTPKFTSLSGIQKARDRITTKEATEAAKEGATNDLFTLAEKFRPYGGGGNEFGFLDSFTQNLGDWARGRVRLEEFYPGVPQELKSEALQMLGRLRNAPVGYFEAKPQRAVGIGEFRGAVVPENAPSDVVKLLEKYGLRLERYKTPEEKAAAIRKFQEYLFAIGGASALPLGLLSSGLSSHQTQEAEQ